jgi:hypothetical protein
MGIDVIIRTTSGDYISHELPSCRGGERRFWEGIFPGYHLHEGTEIPLKEFIDILESKIKEMTREEIIEAYMSDSCGYDFENPLSLYKIVYEYKDSTDYVLSFE